MDYKAVTDIAKNRLYLSISGSADEKSLDKLLTDIQSCLPDLKPGFEVIVDLSQCNVIYVRGLENYKKIMDYLVAKKVGEIVRIIKHNNVSYKQIIQFTDKIQCYKAMYANSIEEAEERLGSIIYRDGIRFKLNKNSVKVKVNNEQIVGHVIDISTSGCAVEASLSDISIDSEIIINIVFEENDLILSQFETKAKVIRKNDQMFAVQFLNQDEDGKDKLYERLAFEAGRSL
jgi:hypothetical protein